MVRHRDVQEALAPVAVACVECRYSCAVVVLLFIYTRGTLRCVCAREYMVGRGGVVNYTWHAAARVREGERGWGVRGRQARRK